MCVRLESNWRDFNRRDRKRASGPWNNLLNDVESQHFLKLTKKQFIKRINIDIFLDFHLDWRRAKINRLSGKENTSAGSVGSLASSWV